eukprot:6947357-Prymnesium_polylepis.1
MLVAAAPLVIRSITIATGIIAGTAFAYKRSMDITHRRMSDEMAHAAMLKQVWGRGGKVKAKQYLRMQPA